MKIKNFIILLSTTIVIILTTIYNHNNPVLTKLKKTYKYSQSQTNTFPNPSINPVATTPTATPTDPQKPPQNTNSNQKGSCMITGCSGEICSNQEISSICIYKDEYACYKYAKCETQTDGNCGWTMDDQLTACLGASI